MRKRNFLKENEEKEKTFLHLIFSLKTFTFAYFYESRMFLWKWQENVLSLANHFWHEIS